MFFTIMYKSILSVADDIDVNVNLNKLAQLLQAGQTEGLNLTSYSVKRLPMYYVLT